jgi:hypothetical protein
MYAIAERQYRATLDAHAVLDFPDVLLYTLKLLGQMEEFSQSRYRLESRYHHVLVDEFQDTSRAQWELVSLLVRAWGEGAGLAFQGPVEPTVFIVGDRKQSIYGFRDADVAVLGEAGRAIAQLRPGGDVRRSISRSFRSVPALLSFVNDVGADVDKLPARIDAFAYGEDDVFRRHPSAPRPHSVWSTGRTSKRAATPPPRLRRSSGTAYVRDRDTGVARPSVRATWPSSSDPRGAIASSRTLALAGLPSPSTRGWVLRRRRDQGPAGVAVVSRRTGVRSARGRVLRSRFVRLSDEALLPPAWPADALW